jgi:hypothetical protein
MSLWISLLLESILAIYSHTWVSRNPGRPSKVAIVPGNTDARLHECSPGSNTPHILAYPSDLIAISYLSHSDVILRRPGTGLRSGSIPAVCACGTARNHEGMVVATPAGNPEQPGPRAGRKRDTGLNRWIGRRQAGPLFPFEALARAAREVSKAGQLVVRVPARGHDWGGATDRASSFFRSTLKGNDGRRSCG